jgi:hypothetical protein
VFEKGGESLHASLILLAYGGFGLAALCDMFDPSRSNSALASMSWAVP